MSVTGKIRALMNLTNKDHAAVAAALGISKQALSNKFTRDSFSADDLIVISEALGCSLMFVADDVKIALTMEDVRAKTPTK